MDCAIVDAAVFDDNVLSFAKTVFFQLRRKRHYRRSKVTVSAFTLLIPDSLLDYAQNPPPNTAAQPKTTMKSRRLITAPKAHDSIVAV